MIQSDDNVGHRINIGNDAGACVLRTRNVSKPFGTALILPGANCRAAKYDWLADGLSDYNFAVCIIDPPLRMRPRLSEVLGEAKGHFVTPPMLRNALQYITDRWIDRPLILIGHSLGGAVLLESLDPQEACRHPQQSDWGALVQYPPNLHAVITLGSALGTHVGTLQFPWRSNGPLSRQSDIVVDLIAGDADTLVPAHAVRQTARRFTPPADFFQITGATHFGWTYPSAAPISPGKLRASHILDPDHQREITIQRIGGHLPSTP